MVKPVSSKPPRYAKKPLNSKSNAQEAGVGLLQWGSCSLIDSQNQGSMMRIGTESAGRSSKMMQGQVLTPPTVKKISMNEIGESVQLFSNNAAVELPSGEEPTEDLVAHSSRAELGTCASATRAGSHRSYADNNMQIR